MVDIIKTDRFKLYQLGESIIIFGYKDDLRNIELNLNKITNHTVNTWEANRNQSELYKNTLQGKIVEEFFIDLINYKNKINNKRQLSFISYDAFRSDSFEKHAPFDGLIFEEHNSNVAMIINEINACLSNNEYGKLDNKTLDLCKENRIYTVEIKSSKIPYNIYKNLGDRPRSVPSQLNLINNLTRLDLFKYPEFNRVDGDSIHNAEKYLSWVKGNIDSMRGKSDKEILASERNSSTHLHTRIFIDDKLKNSEGKELFIGYFLGYALGYEFYENFRVMNFPSDKSGKALYVTFPFAKSKTFSHLFEDTRLWSDKNSGSILTDLFF
jgi:hypothetical protein